MALYRSEAVVLRRFNLGEADRIVSFLTREQGKLRAVARSAKRAKSKFAGSLEPLSHVHLEYYGKENTELFRVNSADVVRSFDKLRRDYEKVKGALVMADLLDRLLEDVEPQTEIFDLSLAVLAEMETSKSAGSLLILFEIRFLRQLGYQPNLDQCARCGEDLGAAGAVFQAGGAELYCPDCIPDGTRLSPGAVKHLAAVSGLPLLRAFQIKAVRSVQVEAQRFLQAYLTVLSGSRLKSFRFLNS